MCFSSRFPSQDNFFKPKTNHKNFHGSQVHVPLSRRFGYAVINIYLPSLIMAIVGYLTLFFLTDNFEVRVMTSLTTLLVLATISNQVCKYHCCFEIT